MCVCFADAERATDPGLRGAVRSQVLVILTAPISIPIVLIVVNLLR